jgi:SAM-dependent MidA family methyltransferase
MSTNLRAIIERELADEGRITFARFMELALYCPNFGYYERPGKPPGRQGDFYTSVSVGSLFGILLAAQFAEWLAALPANGGQIVEAGAHDGQLAGDLLRALRDTRPQAFGSCEYWIIEPSAVRRASQEQKLQEFSGRVRWFRSWDEIPAAGIHGVIFANELLDAMPVHRLGWDAAARTWFEWGVALEGENFVWRKAQSPKPKVQSPELSAELLAVLPDGFTTEVCPAATDWWQRAAAALRSGKLLTFDYGLTAEEFFTPERRDGTLRAYYRHHPGSDLLARPGEQDLTTQVNFTAMIEAGESAGLVTESFTNQAQFLTTIVERLAGEPKFRELLAAQSRQFQTLTHPEHLGRKFRVLLQGRPKGARASQTSWRPVEKVADDVRRIKPRKNGRPEPNEPATIRREHFSRSAPAAGGERAGVR